MKQPLANTLCFTRVRLVRVLKCYKCSLRMLIFTAGTFHWNLNWKRGPNENPWSIPLVTLFPLRLLLIQNSGNDARWIITFPLSSATPRNNNNWSDVPLFLREAWLFATLPYLLAFYVISNYTPDLQTFLGLIGYQ